MFLVSLVGLASVCIACNGRNRTPVTRAEIVSLLGRVRLVEARLGGWRLDAKSSTLDRHTDEAVIEMRRRLHVQLASPQSQEFLASAALLSILDGDLVKAASFLEAAGRGGDVLALSDLTAVRLELGIRHQDPLAIVHALAAADQAQQRNAMLPEAVFNRALVLEHLGLVVAARDAWRHYLLVDGASAWSSEARRHLSLLDAIRTSAWKRQRPELETAAMQGDRQRMEAIVRRFPQNTRLYLEEDLLTAWGQAMTSGKALAAEQLGTSAVRIGQVLLGVTGDRLAAASARTLQSASRGQLSSLAAGHRDFGRGVAFYKTPRIGKALFVLDRAQKELAAAESPFQLWASLYLAACHYQRKNFALVLRATDEIKTVARRESYLNLLGRAAWLAGLVHLEQGRPDAASDEFRLASSQFQRTGELAYQASIAALLANAQAYLGDSRQAWSYRHHALTLVPLIADDPSVPVILGEAARALAADGEEGVGLDFASEALSLERGSGDPLSISEALWWRAILFAHAGEERLALRDLAEARLFCAKIPSEEIRLRTFAGLAATEAGALRDSDRLRSLALFNQALEVYRRLRYSYLLAVTYHQRGLSALALGTIEQAEDDFAASIAEYEQQRDEVQQLPQQITFFDRAEQVFDDMIALQLDNRRRPEEALAYAERSRSRVLLAALQRAHPSDFGDASPRRRRATPLPPSDLRRGMPADTTLIEYSVLETRIVAWILTSRGVLAVGISTPHPVLREMIRSLLEEVESSSGRSGSILRRRLFEVLVSPLLSSLPPTGRLVVVPDKELQSVPFACLVNPRTGRAMVQDFDLSYAPSATTFVWLLERHGPRAQRRSLTALAIGNPAFRRDHFPNLPTLLEAEAEARSVAATFAGSELLEGKAATVDRFLSLVDRHEIIHFSGHALVPPSAALTPRLLFAPTPAAPEGELPASAIYRLRLTRPKLVVLAACDSANGPVSPLEGVLDLARPFLAAGVPSVLSSLWRVDDAASRQLLAAFYASFSRTQDPINALRQAQLSFLTSPDPRLSHPAAWAGFQLIGAASPAANSP